MIFLTSGTSWTVPSDWNNAANTIEVIGGGGGSNAGVMNNPVNILVDGAAATQFLSTNPVMGASRELWFLHGDFLYEVTASPSLDSWLLQIMQTWQFM